MIEQQTTLQKEIGNGIYNADDLNRVESWCRYLADELNGLGYNIQITTKTKKTNWTTYDLRSSSNMTRIKNNILALMTGYHYITPIYSSVDSWNYTKANRWEQILNEIWNMVCGMENWYVYAGVANAGQNRTWQNRFHHNYIAPTIQANPPLYTPLQYIQSDGSQYIDTGVKPYQTKVEIAFAYSGTGQTGTKNICGCWNANNNRFYVCWCNATVIGTTNRSNTNIALKNPWDNLKHFLIYNDANNKIIFDNVEKGTISDLTTESSSTIYLFSMNYNGSYNPAISKIYRVRITNKATNTIIRDFIPVLDQNQTPCMFDLVNNQFYYNSGTGNFTYSY